VTVVWLGSRTAARGTAWSGAYQLSVQYVSVQHCGEEEPSTRW